VDQARSEYSATLTCIKSRRISLTFFNLPRNVVWIKAKSAVAGGVRSCEDVARINQKIVNKLVVINSRIHQ